ncbi:unnamed protein product [Closterium sp. Naga37s-1]|nr:unnamed protein product [Closterium sp. Naga37s-1]
MGSPSLAQPHVLHSSQSDSAVTALASSGRSKYGMQSGGSSFGSACSDGGSAIATPTPATAGVFPVQKFQPGVVFSSPMHLPHQDAAFEAPNSAGVTASGFSPGESSVSPGSSHGSWSESPVVSSKSLSGASPVSADPAAMIPRHSSLTAISNSSAASAAAARHVRSNTGSPKTIFRYVLQPGQVPPGSISQIEKSRGEASSTTGNGMKRIGEGAVEQEKEKAVLKEGGGGSCKADAATDASKIIAASAEATPAEATPAEAASVAAAELHAPAVAAVQAARRPEPVPQGAALRAGVGPVGETFTPGGAAKGASAVAAIQAARRPESMPQGAAVGAFAVGNAAKGASAAGAAEGAAVGAIAFRAASCRAPLRSN